MNDPSGTDRWVVFEVEGFENRRHHGETHCCVEDFSIEQCWSWAYREYKKGATGEYTSEWLEQNEKTNEAFKYNCDAFEILQEYLVPAEKDTEDAEFITATQICIYLNNQQEHVKFSGVPIGKALRRLKFEQVQCRVDGKMIRGYWVKKPK